MTNDSIFIKEAKDFFREVHPILSARVMEIYNSRDFFIDENSKKIRNYAGKYWKNAEITNGRLAMIGFLALIINYGLFGWIIPGFI